MVNWLINQAEVSNSAEPLSLTKKSFSLISRKVKRVNITIKSDKTDLENTGVPSWDIQRLCRVWFLMQINPLLKDNYIKTIDNLFHDAEMHELAALYSALPYLAYPENWIFRCEEGIRSNIGNVLEAIMESNPYPAANLDTPAWNQLVLKAFFTEKDVSKIIGLNERMNEELSMALSDYTAERTSAGRPVHEKIKELIRNYKNKE
jgi:hypothetical protein